MSDLTEPRVGGGQPFKLTQEVVKKLTTGIRLGMTYSLAAQYAGVSASSFQRWLRRGRDGEDGIFQDLLVEMERANADGAARLLAQVNKHAKEDWRAAAWMLERRHRYEKNQKVEVTGQVDVTVDVQVQALSLQLSEMSTEQLEALAWSAPKAIEAAEE